ncbi:BLUF domain-containing protein [Planctomicrobium sp. SH664]|uniref:BLUF domain-containing protein n=1 Tax=Planctomicrobium sp. SH664 TaxID=3448125 RepID=UPI003F5BE6F4
MIQLIYTSAAVTPFSTSDLMKLLQGWRQKNGACGVTGLLLSYQNSFMQVLEGPDEAVEATYARIKVDPRHRWLQQLCCSSISRPIFVGWSMGFVNGDAPWVKGIRGFTEFVGRKGAPSRHDGLQAARLLAEFRFCRWSQKVDTGRGVRAAGELTPHISQYDI